MQRSALSLAFESSTKHTKEIRHDTDSRERSDTMSAPDMSDRARSSYSLPWRADGTGWAAFDYAIVARGSACELRYRGTLLHTGLSADECKAEADRHRGVNR